jgi:dipeptidase E
MRLFLSSQNLGNYPEEFVKLVGPNKKLALVENAKDDWSIADRTSKVNEHLDQLKSIGFKVFELDLRDYFDKQKELEKVLAKCGGIFISGGNTFILTRAFKYSGAGKLLYDMVRKNEIAYGGSSAGSIIATPSLKGSELGDSPEVTPKGYKYEIIWHGLDFVNFYIVPHYKSSWFGKEAEAMLNYFKQHCMPHRVLKDGQVILINGDKEEFLE